MPDLLLEIGTEEVPASVVVPALNQLQALVGDLLTRERIAYTSIRTAGTPRRLVLYAEGVAGRQEDASLEHRGPTRAVAFAPDGSPSKAAVGFARRYGLTPDALEVRETESGAYVFAVQHVEGRPTEAVLGGGLPAVLTALTFPKFMRWGSGVHRFCRPVRSLTVLLDDCSVSTSFAGVESGRVIRGHRFLPVGDAGGSTLELASAGAYFDAVRAARIVVDPEERRAEILRQGNALAAAEGVRVAWDEDLLHEVVFVVECPTAFLGKFSEEYLELPRPVLVSAMKKHQRYFTVERPDGSLAPMFLAVRNGGDYGLDTVRSGNERVLAFRFNDARHHYVEDARVTLPELRERLRRIVFIQRLGTVWDRSVRLADLAPEVCAQLGWPDLADESRIAGELCKADLASHMVAELPELQGVMGAQYAARDGLSPAVADAIAGHYLPRGAGDTVPEGRLARVLALVDRVDLLTSAFTLGHVPTGSSDPFGLRRAAAGVVALAEALPVDLNLSELLSRSLASFAGTDYYQSCRPVPADQVASEVTQFIRPRVEARLDELGSRRDLTDAVLSAGFDSISGALDRARFLNEQAGAATFSEVTRVATRIRNILKPLGITPPSGDLAKLCHPSEIELRGAWVARSAAASCAAESRIWRELWSQLESLVPTVDRFFDDVLVNDPDETLRSARQTLLWELDGAFRSLADFSRIADVPAAGGSR